jgi:uncharacterized membrane protein YhaH (DUF805 family)
MTYWECVKELISACWKLILATIIIIPVMFYISSGSILTALAGIISVILVILFIAHTKWDMTYNNPPDDDK